MAILAFSNDDRNAQRPLTAHPAFPAIVALWFAVLLGLGTLVLPPALMEHLILAGGIASLVPAASPPLDFTARTLISVVAAATGAMAGFASARRMAASHADNSSNGRPGGAVRPLSAREELGDLLDWAESEPSAGEENAAQIGSAPTPHEGAGECPDLAELVARLGRAIERHRARSSVAESAASTTLAAAAEPMTTGYVSDDTEAALRSALARLRQLREAA